MKLFLASSFDKTISEFVSKVGSLSGKRVLFIKNAADPYTRDTWWVNIDRDAYIRQGCEIIDLDLKEINSHDLEKKLEGVDIVHFTGGSILYLQKLLIDKGLMGAIINKIKEGEVIYTGTSAGAILPSGDISLYKYEEEERELGQADLDGTYKGLSVVNFVVLPHCNNADAIAGSRELINHFPENKEAYIMLSDNQAVWVEDNKIEIVSI